jgi:hypothetical protein
LPILPSIVHGSRNDELLRLSECIESLKSEVKQKMMDGGERNRGTKVTATKFPVSELEASRKLRDCFFFSRLFQTNVNSRISFYGRGTSMEMQRLS